MNNNEGNRSTNLVIASNNSTNCFDKSFELLEQQRIILNVGGLKYETTTKTIRRISDTRLTKLLDENIGTNEVFVDRSGELFYLVLNFLRSGTIASDAVGEKDPETIDKLEKEAQV